MRSHSHICYLSLLLITALSACDQQSGTTGKRRSEATPQGPTTPAPEHGKTEEGQPAPIPTPGGAGLGLQNGLTQSRAAFLTQTGSAVALKSQAFAASVREMRDAVQNFCGQLGIDNGNKLAAAQSSWKNTMLQWEEFELLTVGPLADNARDLKFQIYAFPQDVNRCLIDQEAMNAQADAAGYQAPSFANRKGLGAIEYLLFQSSLASSCSASNKTGIAWNALSTEQKWAARCAYLQVLTSELQEKSQELEQGWGTPRDNVLSRAVGDANAEKGALQALYNGLFYFDLEFKNQKLAAPAGQDVKLCKKSPLPCPEREEFLYSQVSKEAMQANINALVDLTFGYPDLNQVRSGGFSAVIRQEGSEATAQAAEGKVTSLKALFEENQSSFASLVQAKKGENCDESNLSWVCRLREQIKSLASDFKTEYSAALQLAIPAGPQGDND